MSQEQQQWISDDYAMRPRRRSPVVYVFGAVGAVLFLCVGGTAVVAAAAGVIGGGPPVEIVEARPAEARPTTPPPAVAINNPLPERTTEPPATKTPTVKPTKTGPTYKPMTARTWLTIVKDPDAHSGDRVVIYGRVAQFDATTGADRFVALAGPTPYQDSSVVITAFRGKKKLLADFVKNDLFRANAVVVGTTGYKSVEGVITYVPDLRITSIKALGG